MAVYTHITEDQLKEFLSAYDAGELTKFEPIEQGVENSNYHVFTGKGRYILTIYEKRVSEKDLPFFFDYMTHLAVKGIKSPKALENKDGAVVGHIADKPAALISFLEGHNLSTADITEVHCREIGDISARMHLAVEDFKKQRGNSMGYAAWKELAAKTRDRADEVFEGLASSIDLELRLLVHQMPAYLPKGAVHADLFPDNVFFQDGRVSGVIDFYFSCTDFFVYDLALSVNAWCFDSEQNFRRDYFDELITTYNTLRPMTQGEVEHFTVFCRAAALRILLTRLHDWLFHDPESIVKPKDPLEYVRILKYHQKNPLGR